MASSTSKKHKEFVAEPMGEKSIQEVPGIGDVLGKRLIDSGFDKAYVLLGQFLVLKKDKEAFVEWFKEESGGNKHQAESAYSCLKEWCDAFL